MQPNLLEQLIPRFKKLCLSQLVGTFFVFGLWILFTSQNKRIPLYNIDIILTVIFLFLIVCLALFIYKIWGKSYAVVLRTAIGLLACDALLVTMITHKSGGVDSFFSSLYLVIIVASGLVVSRRFCLNMSVFCSTIYLFVVVMEKIGAFWDVSLDVLSYQSVHYIIYVLVLKITLFILAAFLSRYFMNEIDIKNRKLNDLTMLYDSVIQNMKTGLLIIGMDKNIVIANPSALHILGKEWPRIKSVPVQSLFPDEEKDKLNYLLMNASEIMKRSRNYELVYKRKGEEIDLGFSLSPLRDASKNIIGSIFLFQDISMKKRYEQNIARIDKNNELGKMAVTIAHELRNPLASLSGSAEVLKEKVSVSDDCKKLFDVIIKESKRLNKIVTDFLELSRVNKPRFHVVELKDLMDEIIMIIKHNKKLPFKTRFDQNIEPNIKILGDSDQLKQAFNNIIFNAIDASKNQNDSTIRIHIYLEDIEEGDRKYAGVCVEDFGEGMTESEKEKIFQAFYSNKKSGTGLGLAVAEHIIHGHQGRIEVKSRKGKGTVFCVLIPKAELS